MSNLNFNGFQCAKNGTVFAVYAFFNFGPFQKQILLLRKAKTCDDFEDPPTSAEYVLSETSFTRDQLLKETGPLAKQVFMSRRTRVSGLIRPGKASEFITHLQVLVSKGLQYVVLYCRVSSQSQDDNGNLVDQMIDAIRTLKSLGIKFEVFVYVESSDINTYRPGLSEAIDYALERNAPLVACSRDRFIRSRSFGPGQPMEVEPPVDFEYHELMRIAKDVPLATILHPDDPSARSAQTRRGQDKEGKKGGRPRAKKPGYKKRKRLELLPSVLKLHDLKWSLRSIASELEVAVSTIRGWILERAEFVRSLPGDPG